MRPQSGRGTISLSVRLALMLMLCAGQLAAQPAVPSPEVRPDLWVRMPDGTAIYRVRPNGDTLPAHVFSPAYLFTMAYDTTSHTEYRFTETRRNGQPIPLMNWKDKRTVHMDARQLSFNSRTADFAIAPGDTISFYRELSWINPVTRGQFLDNYYALDTLDFTAHLVRLVDGAPLALLDSIGILDRQAVGSPRIYGTHPLMSVVRYVVPPTIDADSAFIGVTVRARGSGPHHFVRRDDITVRFSQRLEDPDYIYLMSLYGSLFSKRDLRDATHDPATANDSASLEVRGVPGSPRDIMITFRAPTWRGATSIAVHDISGALVFAPYISVPNGHETVPCTLAAPGMYFVSLVQNGAILRSQPITITK